MRFWDSSAVVPLVLEEKGTETVRALVRDDRTLLVWLLTPLEIWTALCRRKRAGELDEPAFRRASGALQDLEDAWGVVADVPRVVGRARRLVATHPLLSADGLQLAGALVACGERPERIPFVCVDERLAECARREGFTVLP